MQVCLLACFSCTVVQSRTVFWVGIELGNVLTFSEGTDEDEYEDGDREEEEDEDADEDRDSDEDGANFIAGNR